MAAHRVPRRVGAVLVLLVGIGVGGGVRAVEAAASPGYVIPSGLESLFLKMADPGKAGFPGGFRLEGVSIDRDNVVATYRGAKGREVALQLRHPEGASGVLATTDRFAIGVAGEAAADKVATALAKALARRVKAHEGAFQWSRPASLAEEAPRVPSGVAGHPGMWLPEIPPNGRSVAFLGTPTWPVVQEASPEYEAIRQLAKAGKLDEMKAKASALAKAFPKHASTVRAAASALRTAGDGASAAALLEPLAPAGQSLDPEVTVERAASLELAGRPDEAETLVARIAREAPSGRNEAACFRADALTLLMREGRVVEAAKRIAQLKPQAKLLCDGVLRMRLAIAQDDPAALEAAGKAATDAFPDDPDLWFLWGAYYWNKKDLQHVMAPWDRLVALKPDYPSALGLYITTYLVGGRLGPETIPSWTAKADKAPDDPVANYLAAISVYYKANDTHLPADYARSIPYFERVVAKIPQHQPRAWMYLGMAHFFNGDQAKAQKILEDLEPYTYHEPDINYCRSLAYRKTDLPRAIAEMEKFLSIFLGEDRPGFGPAKIQKAKDDLEAMRRGEVPSYWLKRPNDPD